MEIDEDELIDKAQRGDARAFSILVERYDKRIFAFARSYCGNTDDARDAYQEIFLHAYRGLPTFRRTCSLGTWLYKIAFNTCYSLVQRRKDYVTLNEETLAGISTKTDAELPLLAGEIRAHYQRAIAQLSPRQRAVFLLKHDENKKIREIAEILDCSEGTVKGYLHEAMTKLRWSLKEFAE